jgi:hypothetical protein
MNWVLKNDISGYPSILERITDAPGKSSSLRPDPQRGEGAVQKMA